MDQILSASWWILALRGVIAILFGVLALIWPGLTLLGLIALFAAYALLGGAVSVIGALRNRKRHEDWGLLLMLGLAALGAGVIAAVHPALTAIVLVLLIGANALVSGMLDIVAAIRLRKAIRHEWMLALNGAASVIFGVLAFLFPGAGALALIWLISFYAVLTGALLLAAAFRIRGMAARRPPVERRVTPDRRSSSAQPRPV
ncbi:HdeD family acid-resistance protein [Noviherbaspirillum massiliense]|uniref:HdeD family acid-resistance protein n=1 Tax=Noviherbaspirillum massiliense TaxID=1465823 RepID=UPI0002E2FCCE|nr:HdeD family acid-resistance protein [Noviherbaspirillum massiliense]